jgi:hypothetical protein
LSMLSSSSSSRRHTCFCIVLITPSTLVFRELASPYTSTRLTPHSLIPPDYLLPISPFSIPPLFSTFYGPPLLPSALPWDWTAPHFFASSNQLLLHLYKKVM